ncbi:hypothetical protein P5673_004543 [Acropora cervicornis]|uniref:Uncharacterized protein n=1 Tax=Acropora cervicornis TaxID=6130 RepID=A0AAD9VDV3_ACRCE|nr:hypothetical protein P5673_004543 [Acropora cervicornis]
MMKSKVIANYVRLSGPVALAENDGRGLKWFVSLLWSSDAMDFFAMGHSQLKTNWLTLLSHAGYWASSNGGELRIGLSCCSPGD